MSESIWFATPDLATINAMNKGNLNETLRIEFTEIGPDYLRAIMPVSDNIKQPFGIVHGGASVSLAESMGSVGAYLTVDPDRFYGVGLDINANHLKAVSSGVITGTTKPLHRGRTTQVWEIQLHNDQGQLTCISRLTVAILAHP